MIDYNEIQRDDPETALAYLREQAAKLDRRVSAETLGMLAMMQSDYPDSYELFARTMRREGIEVVGEYI